MKAQHIKRSLTLILFLHIQILIFQGKAKPLASNPLDVKPGTLMDSIYCKNDNTQFYALYVPSSYDHSKLNPIIYIFEPAARAKLPLTLYKDLAEKHGFLLACSYNSKNGPIVINEEAFLKMSNDIKTWLNLDPNMQFTSGFSGGGRFSQLVAQNNQNITGVIAVAGPKGDGALFNESIYKTPYVGIVGNRDMNYLEHIRFQERLNKMGVKNELITYNAAHQWPPKEIFDQAIYWHLAIQNQLISKEKTAVLNDYLKVRSQYLDSTLAMSSVEKHTGYRSISRNFENADVSKKTEQFESEKKFDKYLKQEDKILQDEEEDQIKLVQALNEFRSYYFRPGFNPDSGQYALRWWKSEIGQISNKVNTESAKGLSAARLIDFLRGQVHNQVQSAKMFNNSNLILSMHELNLYLYPNSVWFLWNQAVLCAQYNKKEEALLYIERAKKINNGLLTQITQNIAFSSFKDQFPYLFD